MLRLRTIQFIFCTLSIATTSGPTLFAAKGEEEFHLQRFSSASIPPSETPENIISDGIKPLGTIVGAFKKNKYFATGDTVYLRFNDSGVSVGDKFSVYQDLGGITIPGKLSKVGHNIMIKGSLIITKVLPGTVVGKIYESNFDMHFGDTLTTLFDLKKEYHPKEPKEMVQGVVLASSTGIQLIAAYSFAFIDKGRKQGIEVNDLLYVFRTADGNSTITKGLPEVNIAEMVVVDVQDNFATVYCRAASDAFSPGAHFKGARSEERYLEDQTPSSNAKDPNQGDPADSLLQHQ